MLKLRSTARLATASGLVARAIAPRSVVWGRRFASSETNVPSEMNRLEKTLDKFWTKVAVGEYQGADLSGYVVTLDSKPIKTPLGLPLVIPEEKQKATALAHLISQEWAILSSLNIKPHVLPLTSLAARAVDLKYSAEGPAERERTIDLLLPYLDTDTLLTFSPIKDCEGELRPAQDAQYAPVIAHAEKFWDVKLETLDTEITLFGCKQSEETKRKVRDWINSLDHWQFAALERATTTAKSLIGAMNVITYERTPDEVARLVGLETIFQTELWGEVEDTHDVDHADVRRILGSAHIVARK